MDKIIIKGAREHNLQNVSLAIPKNKFVVFTGVSGSGKSSLAFDTIYAEGQRRYVESLTSYARQFLGIMSKPDVDFIEGLSPAISIDQKSVSHNPRSTVGTVTEIYDYLRLLYARIGHPHCPLCGREISQLSADEMVKKILDLVYQEVSADKIKPHSFSIISPLVKEKKGEFSGLLSNLRAKGFTQVIIDNHQYGLENEILLIKTNKHTIDTIIDTFSLNYKNLKDEIFLSNFKSRLFNAVENSLNLSGGKTALKWAHTSLLFSEQFSCPHCNLSLPEIEPRIFSFNSPLGACEGCKGLGFISAINPEKVINPTLSINEGALVPFGMVFFNSTWYSRLLKSFLEDVRIDQDKPLAHIKKHQLDLLLYGNNKTYKVKGKNRFGIDTVIFEQFRGIIHELETRYSESNSDFTRYEIGKYMEEKVCAQCQGKRLKKEVLSIVIHHKNIYDIGELSIVNLLQFIQSISEKLTEYENEIAGPIITEIVNRLLFLQNVGLSYLTLNRTSRTLSGGESQRIRLASQIGSGLTGVIYVLDEPSIGLHPRDVSALVNNLKKLRDLGNSIIVVEHDQETIQESDHVVDFGPFAGKEGGKIIFNGTFKDLKKCDNSLTRHYLFEKRMTTCQVPQHRNILNKKSTLSIRGCRLYNLKNISASFPLGFLTCVTGVSGSGKSTLVVETVYPALRAYLGMTHSDKKGGYTSLEGYQYLDSVYLVDQSSIGRTPRSNPATYIGIFDHVRDVFALTTDARMRGYKKGRFSFNVKGGRCEKCLGAGTIKIEMHFLPDVYITCDVCQGKRYNSETLEVQYKGKRIDQVLQFTVHEALDFFKGHPHIYKKLHTLQEVGLGYLELGQPAPTLSGGEAQRMKLALELSKKDSGRTLYILDEPTTGLHPYDIEKLMQTLYTLIARGNTIIVIEHNLAVIKKSGYVIDLGPEGGDGGGYILYQGAVEGIYDIPHSYTGMYLKKYEDRT